MSKEDAHQFCWKDCAVYITIDLGDKVGSTGVGVERVFNYLYRTWIRDDEENLDIGHFFGRGVCCWETGGLKMIKEIVEAHRVICEKVREKQADERADEDEVFEWNRRHGDFLLKRSFERFFVVVDQAVWWERGVLLVRSERAKEVEADEVKGEWPIFGEGDKGWAVRMGMKEVVDLVRGIEDAGKERG